MAVATFVRSHAAIALLLLSHSALAQHPCAEEVASACADRPTSDIGACLKTPDEHDYPTEISSGCTDFIALNKACADDIEQHCDSSGAYHDDTILCLTKWTQPDNLSPKCAGVLSWAVPEAESSETVVTDELGMSDADYAEKEEWKKKRKAAREEAMAKMGDMKTMKEEDRKKEEDRVALEEFKKNDPDGYDQMIHQQEEEVRQQAEFKKKERARAAAILRAKKEAAGESEEDDQKPSGAKSPRKLKESKGSWVYTIFSFLVVCVVGALVYGLVQASGSKNGGKGRKQPTKKKRG